MQSVHFRDKFTVLILLAASTMFAVLASDIGSGGEAGQAWSEQSRLLLAFSLAGSLIAVLMLLSPGKDRRSLRATLRDSWLQLAGLAALVIGYALALPALGLFFATLLFLALGYLLLGERRWWPLFLLCLPAAAALHVIMHGLQSGQIADPFLRVIGLSA